MHSFSEEIHAIDVSVRETPGWNAEELPGSERLEEDSESREPAAEAGTARWSGLRPDDIDSGQQNTLAIRKVHERSIAKIKRQDMLERRNIGLLEAGAVTLYLPLSV